MAAVSALVSSGPAVTVGALGSTAPAADAASVGVELCSRVCTPDADAAAGDAEPSPAALGGGLKTSLMLVGFVGTL